MFFRLHDLLECILVISSVWLIFLSASWYNYIVHIRVLFYVQLRVMIFYFIFFSNEWKMFRVHDDFMSLYHFFHVCFLSRQHFHHLLYVLAVCVFSLYIYWVIYFFSSKHLVCVCCCMHFIVYISGINWFCLYCRLHIVINFWCVKVCIVLYAFHHLSPIITVPLCPLSHAFYLL